MEWNEEYMYQEKKPLKVLLIEDDPDDAHLIKEELREMEALNFQIEHVESMEPGLQRLSAENMDVVLLDLFLPDGFGMDNVLMLKNNFPHVPVVVISGLEEEFFGVQAIKEGAQDFVVKDKIDGQQFARSIQYAIERQRIIRKMEEIRQLEQQVNFYDSLTGLPNRQLFYSRLQKSIARARRDIRIFGLILIDLDNFTKINATMGFHIGDNCLKLIAEGLSSCIKEADMIARLEDDEFIILVDDLTHPRDMAYIAHQVLSQINRVYRFDSQAVTISASMGISLYPFDGSKIETLIENASTALKAAREKGNNGYRFYNIWIENNIVDMDFMIPGNLIKN